MTYTNGLRNSHIKFHFQRTVSHLPHESGFNIWPHLPKVATLLAHSIYFCFSGTLYFLGRAADLIF